MKSHFGPFEPNHSALASHVFKINESTAVIGGFAVRQQLCSVDFLLANKAANVAAPEVMPCCLVMGIAPAVNDLTVEQVRETVMGRTLDSAAVHSLMTRFGYLSTESGVGRWFPPRGASGAAAVLA